MAEAERFERSKGFPLPVFKTGALDHYATPPLAILACFGNIGKALYHRQMVKKVLYGIILLFALIGLVFTAVFVAMRFDLLNVRGTIDERNDFFGDVLGVDTCAVEVCAWQDTPEWATVREGLRKDADVLTRVSVETGVPARLIAAVVVPEQLRFFTSEREVYKQVFEPLKILGSLSQFSLGVSGIKQETATEINRRRGELVEPQVLYTQLTDPKDHYYSYLYTALFIKQIVGEWAAAGHPIDTEPAIIATLFNIGFENSHPNPTPQVGGAQIEVGGTVYTFGELAGSFYHSAELNDVLPD